MKGGVTCGADGDDQNQRDKMTATAQRERESGQRKKKNVCRMQNHAHDSLSRLC